MNSANECHDAGCNSEGSNFSNRQTASLAKDQLKHDGSDKDNESFPFPYTMRKCGAALESFPLDHKMKHPDARVCNLRPSNFTNVESISPSSEENECFTDFLLRHASTDYWKEGSSFSDADSVGLPACLPEKISGDDFSVEFFHVDPHESPPGAATRQVYECLDKDEEA